MSGVASKQVMDEAELLALFTSEAIVQMARLQGLADALRRDPEAGLPLLQQMREIVHILKGQGSSFGFPLLTRIGELLSVRLKHLRTPDAEQAERVAAHVDAMALILDKSIQGDGGELGEALVERLRTLPS